MSMETPPQEPLEPKPPEKKKVDFTNFRTIRPSTKKETKLDDLLSFAKENTRDTIAYILMVVGILLMLFDSTSIYGSLIVGIVFSLYFIKELAYFIKHASEISAENGIVKSLIFGGLLLSLFLRAPFIFIGIAIIIGLKLLLMPDSLENKEE